MKMDNKSKLFTVNSTNADFNQRQKNIFDQLNVIESNKNAADKEKMEIDEDNRQKNRRRQRSETKNFRGKESIFKKPQHPVPRNYINKTPDYKKNPHKWTKYSLEDVEDITDESNRKSALSFLKELSDRKKLESGLISDEDKKLEELPKKIIFKKHINISSKRCETDVSDNSTNHEKPQLRNFKVVMPEYVIGEKIKKEKRNATKVKIGKELKLDHLFEDE